MYGLSIVTGKMAVKRFDLSFFSSICDSVLCCNVARDDSQ